ncbi:MAG: slipin family protein [Myxococcota bacterium]
MEPQSMIFLAVVLITLLLKSFKVINEYERAVVFRFGRLLGVKGPGIILLIPMVDRAITVSLRTLTMDVPPQDVITRDNVSVKVSAVVYFRVLSPERAIVEVEDFLFATSQLSQTTLRSVSGQADLDDLLAEREKMNLQIQTILDRHTEPWGIKVASVEVKHIDLPQEMQRAMARQAEAERERRSKVILADAELQASHKLSEAAGVLERNPAAIQIRYLQTLSEIAAEKNSTTIFPLPIELLKAFVHNKKSDD